MKIMNTRNLDAASILCILTILEVLNEFIIGVSFNQRTTLVVFVRCYLDSFRKIIMHSVVTQTYSADWNEIVIENSYLAGDNNIFRSTQ